MLLYGQALVNKATEAHVKVCWRLAVMPVCVCVCGGGEREGGMLTNRGL